MNLNSFEGSFGLQGMRERLGGVGGTLCLQSHPGQGFLASFAIPNPVLKDTPSEELACDIRGTATGGSVLSPAVAGRVIAEMVNRDQATAPPNRGARVDKGGREQLSERELEVLGLAGKGQSNREIGERLSLAEGNVKNHFSSLLSKLHLRDRVQAVLFAREQGWL